MTSASDSPQPIRVGILALVFGSLTLVSLRALLQPEVALQKLPEPTYELPTAIALEGWQLQNTHPWKHKKKEPQDSTEPEAFNRSETTAKSEPEPDGKQYVYANADSDLTVQTRFLGRAGNGNTSRLLQTYTPVRPASVRIITEYQDGIGYSGFFIFEGQASILACVNPSGETTVTGQQFSQTVKFQPSRALPWLLGNQDLFDRRCLFSILSVPARSGDLTRDRYPELEAAWLAWATHWQGTF